MSSDNGLALTERDPVAGADDVSLSVVARQYVDAGLCALPAVLTEKRPALGQWKRYQTRLPKDTEIDAWFANDHDGLCLLAGAASGNLEMIDFDFAGEAFPAWQQKVQAVAPDLFDRLVIESSQSGGYHVVYRCEEDVCGSLKLARRRQEVAEEDVLVEGDKEYVLLHGKKHRVQVDIDGTRFVIVTLIETRGEGGLFLCHPTASYELAQGELVNIPVLTEAERETILRAAWELNEYGTHTAPSSPVLASGGQVASLGGRDEGDVRSRAVAYVDACPGAISGQNGHNQTFAVTQALVNGFCLEPDVALNVLLEHYNPRCDPPWSEKQLLHKVKSALEHPANKPKGWLLDGNSTAMMPMVDISELVEMAAGSAEISADQPESRRLKLVRADQIEMRPPDWLLRGVLERDTFALVFGDPGCGKSFLAIDWAARIATGTPWREHAVQVGPVVYVAGEGQQGFGRRIRAWSEYTGVDMAGAPLFVAPAVAIAEPTDIVSLITAIDAAAIRPTMVVLDTLARCFGGGDENSTQDMSRFVSACDAIRRRYGCTILVVHHTGHFEKLRARGAIALKAALDAEYRLDSTETGLTLTATKMKDAETPPPLDLELVTVELPGMVDDYGNPITSAAVEITDVDTGALVSQATGGMRGKWQKVGLEIALRMIAASSESRASVEDWHSECDEAGMQKSTRYNVLAKLQGQGGLAMDGDWLIPM